MEKIMNVKASFESPLGLSISNYPHNSHSVAANADKSDGILKQEYGDNHSHGTFCIAQYLIARIK